MRKISFLTAVATIAASGALADDYGDFDYFIPAQPYDGQSFEVSKSCVENAVREYVGDVTDFNSETGIIFAGGEDLHAFVAIHGERAESDTAFVSWVEVQSNGSESHINFQSLNGSFTNAAYNDGYEIEGQYDARSLEAYISQCAVQQAALLLG